MDNLDGLCENLRNYFATRSDIAMAFLFGSTARGEQTEDSDLDIAVYFYPITEALEWEEETEFPSTDEVWGDLDSITYSNTDLVVLNRAPATLAYAVLDENRHHY
jgi:predicted nucleotidyltransferase